LVKILPVPEIPFADPESLEARLRKIGKRIREIIEVTPQNKRTGHMEAFPRGACGDCSLIIGTYLLKNGFQNVEYVVGVDDGEQSHAWLECDGVIVDITADQFGAGIQPIIVTKDKSWHSKFKGQKRESCDFREYQDPTIYELYDFSEIMTESMRLDPNPELDSTTNPISNPHPAAG